MKKLTPQQAIDILKTRLRELHLIDNTEIDAMIFDGEKRKYRTPFNKSLSYRFTTQLKSNGYVGYGWIWCSLFRRQSKCYKFYVDGRDWLQLKGKQVQTYQDIHLT